MSTVLNGDAAPADEAAAETTEQTIEQTTARTGAQDFAPLPEGLRKLAANAEDVDLPAPRVEGAIPERLNGALYRNGPGMFERAGHVKSSLLDGDGFVQRLALKGGQASYRAAFVRTPKFLEEEAAGDFVYPTWTTRAPGGMLKNLGGHIRSQAGVTVYEHGGALLALDEVAPIFALDPDTLETTAELAPGEEGKPFSNKAHAKFDPETGRMVIAGGTYGRHHDIHLVERNADGTVASHRIVARAPMVYIHDFFITRTKAVFVFHPATFNPFPFLGGLKSFAECIAWRPEHGNRVLVVNRRGDPEPKWFDAPAAWMWHALNAYDRPDGSIVADFVGFDAPDHFLGPNAELTNFMSGVCGIGEAVGAVRRYVLDPRRGRCEETVIAAGAHEFPTIDPRLTGLPHRTGYLATGGGGALTSGVARLDVETGARDAYDHGADVFAGEPNFAADPDAADPEEGRGWVIQECLDGATGESFFAIFDALALADGPVARVHLGRHAPISFHGWWTQA
ncbi:MAG: carotenoid oxygenase family protein [Maricaulaceae bacterium]